MAESELFLVLVPGGRSSPLTPTKPSGIGSARLRREELVLFANDLCASNDNFFALPSGLRSGSRSPAPHSSFLEPSFGVLAKVASAPRFGELYGHACGCSRSDKALVRSSRTAELRALQVLGVEARVKCNLDE